MHVRVAREAFVHKTRKSPGIDRPPRPVHASQVYLHGISAVHVCCKEDQVSWRIMG